MKLGTPAPDFVLNDQTGSPVQLTAALEQGPVLLLFYPYDQSPDCTEQLCEINVALSQFKARGVTVWGINNAGAESHGKFAEKSKLLMPLLSDENYTVSRKYDALYSIGPLKVIRRSVIGINADGSIGLYERGAPTAAIILGSWPENQKTAKK